MGRPAAPRSRSRTLLAMNGVMANAGRRAAPVRREARIPRAASRASGPRDLAGVGDAPPVEMKRPLPLRRGEIVAGEVRLPPGVPAAPTGAVRTPAVTREVQSPRTNSLRRMRTLWRAASPALFPREKVSPLVPPATVPGSKPEPGPPAAGLAGAARETAIPRRGREAPRPPPMRNSTREPRATYRRGLRQGALRQAGVTTAGRRRKERRPTCPTRGTSCLPGERSPVAAGGSVDGGGVAGVPRGTKPLLPDRLPATGRWSRSARVWTEAWRERVDASLGCRRCRPRRDKNRQQCLEPPHQKRFLPLFTATSNLYFRQCGYSPRIKSLLGFQTQSAAHTQRTF